jgi:hypothetical protein
MGKKRLIGQALLFIAKYVLPFVLRKLRNSRR